MKYNEKWDLVDEGRAALARGDKWGSWTAYLSDDKKLTNSEVESVNRELVRDLDEKHGVAIREQLMEHGTAENVAGLEPVLFDKLVTRRTQEVRSSLGARMQEQLEKGVHIQEISSTTGQHPLFDQQTADSATSRFREKMEVQVELERDGSPLALFIGLGAIVLGLILIPVTGRIFFWPFIIGFIAIAKYAAAKFA